MNKSKKKYIVHLEQTYEYDIEVEADSVINAANIATEKMDEMSELERLDLACIGPIEFKYADVFEEESK